VQPIRRLAGETIDASSIIEGILLPGSVANNVAAAYRTHLFGNATLQDLPLEPRFVINATNVQSGALWRFSRPFMADYRVGLVKNPRIELAVAVAASSAFPPVLSPLRMAVDPASYEPASGEATEDLHDERYMSDVVLTDGGVYDNLGLETAWKRYQTILVSNGGGKMQAEEEPKTDWARHALRINDIIDNQVRSLRVRQLIRAFQVGERTGTYWGIRVDLNKYGVSDALPCPTEQTIMLASLKTRLQKLDPVIQERLVNWGYAVCDAAMRRRVDAALARPSGFPYPASGVG
jgi:NTE family protein